MIPQKIIQFSPIRSGSTLVYNMLRDLFSDTEVIKSHHCEEDALLFPVVSTVRHPLDCIASSILRYELECTDDVLKQQALEFSRNGATDLLKIMNHPHLLLLRYEDFYNNFDVIFAALESFFEINITAMASTRLKERYQIEQIEAMVRSMDSFMQYRPDTQWHGRHISENKGRPGYYRSFFNTEQILLLKQVYRPFLTALNYED